MMVDLLTPQNNIPAIDEWELTNRITRYYIEARDSKRKRHEAWHRNYMIVNNRMYSDLRTNWMPSLTDSEIFPIISTLIAWMTDQEAIFTVTPSADPMDQLAYFQQHLSETLEAIVTSNWTVLDYQRVVNLVIWDAAIYGAGIFKAVWDQALDDGLGNANLCRIDPWKFYPDPNASTMDEAQYFVEVNKMSFEEIERRYPQVAPRLIFEATKRGDSDTDADRRGNSYSSGTYPKANPGVLPGGANTAWGLPGQGRSYDEAPGVNVYEFWLRENCETERQPTDPAKEEDSETIVYDRWRIVVMAGGIILMDELAEDLFEYNRHPYARFTFDDLGEFWPVPIVSHLAPCQIAINRLLASMQQNAELTGNPIFMDPTTSGIARTLITNRPGNRIRYESSATQGSQNAIPQWLSPPAMPSQVYDLVEFWIQRMEHISGLSAIQKGHAPSGRNAQQTINAVQEAGMVRVRYGLRNLQSALRTVGELIIALIVQNYTTPRMIQISGEDGTQSSAYLQSHHFYSMNEDGTAPMKFALMVNAGAANPTSRQARIAEGDTLFQLRAIDREALLKMHQFPHWQEIDERMRQTEQMEVQAGIAEGKSPKKLGRPPKK